MSIKIAPSILTCDFLNLKQQLHEAEKGGMDYLHLDVMDGVFVPNISFGPLLIKSIRPQTKVCFDVHLMIVEPEKYIEAFAKAGANIITVHYEACTHLHRTIQQIKHFNCKAGIAINPATNVSVLNDILHDIDLALLMSVNPGFGGQQFITHTIKKTKELNKIIQEINPLVEIEIDGGVTKSNIKSLVDAGAKVFVAGSAVFNGGDVINNIMSLRQAAN